MYLSDVRAEGEELEEEYAAEVAAATSHEDGAPAKEAYDVRLGLKRVGGRPLGPNDHVALIVVPAAHLTLRGEGQRESSLGRYLIVQYQISYLA